MRSVMASASAGKIVATELYMAQTAQFDHRLYAH
jgi:hypothetical protein